MPQPTNMSMTGTYVWTVPKEGARRSGIDVSSKAIDTWRKFSPFHHDDANAIAVPGSRLRGDSVEGIWQGLKVIGGKTDVSLLKGRPRKRKGLVEGHLFGDVLLGYRDARSHVYKPAYTYHVVNNVVDSVADDFSSRIAKEDVFLYDVGTNGDINDITQPYSHASLLADLLNLLKDAPLPPFSQQRFPYLKDQVDAIVTYRTHLEQNQRALLDDIVTFAYLFSPDNLKQACALHAIQQGIPHQGRLAHYSPNPSTQDLYDAVRR